MSLPNQIISSGSVKEEGVLSQSSKRHHHSRRRKKQHHHHHRRSSDAAVEEGERRSVVDDKAARSRSDRALLRSDSFFSMENRLERKARRLQRRKDEFERRQREHGDELDQMVDASEIAEQRRNALREQWAKTQPKSMKWTGSHKDMMMVEGFGPVDPSVLDDDSEDDDNGRGNRKNKRMQQQLPEQQQEQQQQQLKSKKKKKKKRQKHAVDAADLMQRAGGLGSFHDLDEGALPGVSKSALSSLHHRALRSSKVRPQPRVRSNSRSSVNKSGHRPGSPYAVAEDVVRRKQLGLRSGERTPPAADREDDAMMEDGNYANGAAPDYQLLRYRKHRRWRSAALVVSVCVLAFVVVSLIPRAPSMGVSSATVISLEVKSNQTLLAVSLSLVVQVSNVHWFIPMKVDSVSAVVNHAGSNLGSASLKSGDTVQGSQSLLLPLRLTNTVSPDAAVMSKLVAHLNANPSTATLAVDIDGKVSFSVLSASTRDFSSSVNADIDSWAVF